jgi:hypothetical protein
MKDLRLDLNENDLLVENFDLSLVEGIDQIRQKLQIRLQFFYGEWYLDTTQGVKYFDEIFIKNPTLARVQSILKSVITDTPGVNELLSMACDLDNTMRQLSVSFTVNTPFGEIVMQTGVTLP